MNTGTAIERIATNDHARRELLWLLAKEKGDDVYAEELMEVDPCIMQRLTIAGADVADRAGESSTARRERFGDLYDQTYSRHAVRLGGRRWPT